jgi:hypothetical protein
MYPRDLAGQLDHVMGFNNPSSEVPTLRQAAGQLSVFCPLELRHESRAYCALGVDAFRMA